MKQGWIRLGIVVAGALGIVSLIPNLKIYHFSPFNSGVSAIIALVAGAWLVYSILNWVVERFKN